MEYSEKTKYVPKSHKYGYNKYTMDDNITDTIYNPQKKYHNYRNIISLKKLIFPPISNEKISQLMIDDESIKYITFTSSAQEITNIIMNNLGDFPCPVTSNNQKWIMKSLDKKMKNLVITEMTAGVGGNVLNFAKYFKYVNAIEINTIRYNYLNKNIKLYDFNNVNCYNDDSLCLLINKDDIVQDIIFFDPPWGGKDYKLFTNLRLKFGNFSIENVCKVLFQRERNKMIVIKLPNNYDFDFFNEELKDYQISKFVLDKMTIIVVKKYQTIN
jgi:16S rRNA G966 N2-methylase RsmD